MTIRGSVFATRNEKKLNLAFKISFICFFITLIIKCTNYKQALIKLYIVVQCTCGTLTATSIKTTPQCFFIHLSPSFQLLLPGQVYSKLSSFSFMNRSLHSRQLSCLKAKLELVSHFQKPVNQLFTVDTKTFIMSLESNAYNIMVHL